MFIPLFLHKVLKQPVARPSDISLVNEVKDYSWVLVLEKQCAFFLKTSKCSIWHMVFSPTPTQDYERWLWGNWQANEWIVTFYWIVAVPQSCVGKSEISNCQSFTEMSKSLYLTIVAVLIFEMRTMLQNKSRELEVSRLNLPALMLSRVFESCWNSGFCPKTLGFGWRH